MKKHLYSYLFSFIIVLFTAYVLVDTFVLANSIQVVTTKPIVHNTPSNEHIIIEDDYYKDANVEIKLTQERKFRTDIYVADIKVSSVEYLQTAFAKDTYGKNVTQKTSKIAKDHKAILAVNGDFYGVKKDGYVLKNYNVYRDEANKDREDLVIHKDGSLSIIKESETSIDSLIGAKDILSFGPAIIKDGEIVVEEHPKQNIQARSNPRTTISMIEPLHYLIVVCDGRTSRSKGLTINEMAKFLSEYDVQVAYNLDGGGSSSMVFNNKVINKPINVGRIRERSVSDIVYIG